MDETPGGRQPVLGKLKFDAALDRVQLPVLLLSGWQDMFLRQTLQQFGHLRDRGVDVALTMGPWRHTQLLVAGPGDQRPGNPGMAGHPSGRSPRYPRSGRVRSSSPAKAGASCRTGRRPPPSARSTCSPAVAWPTRRRRRDARRTSATTPPTRPPRSGVDCCPPKADTATTPSWRSPRCAQFHRRRAHPRPLRVRQPGRRVGAQLRQPQCRPVRPGQRDRRQRPVHKRERRLPATW